MATELWAKYGASLAITLTPADKGRIEVYVDGQKIFDRKEEGGKYPDLARVRQIVERVGEKVAASR